MVFYGHMKNSTSTIKLCAFLFLVTIHTLPSKAQSICGLYPGGRIAMASDGNKSDADDHGATAMAIAMLHYAGLLDKLVYVGHSSLYRSGCENAYGNWCDLMDSSSIGTLHRLGGDTSIVYSYEADYSDNGQLDQSIMAFTAAIEASGPGDSLWIYCAGPMDVVYRAISAASPAKRAYVKCISHSSWNENSTFGGLSYKWSDMKSDFIADGVEFYEIKDQNKSNGILDFRDESSSPGSNWSWLSDASAPALWPWLRSRNIDAWFIQKNKAGAFDISDAGMMYWLISGGPDGGCEECGTLETEYLFKNPCANVEMTDYGPIENMLVNVFPNPAEKDLHIQMASGNPVIDLKFMTLTGRVLWQEQLTSKATTLDISDYPSGVYLVLAEADGELSRIKIVKK